MRLSSASTAVPATAADLALLPAVGAAVRAAGEQLLGVYSAATRPADRTGIFAAARHNEDLSVGVLRVLRAAARPQAHWVGDDQETTSLPPGEWWAVDAVEGNVNHAHGLAEWCVSVTLLRDNTPVLTAVHQPVPGLTYTAVQGGGAQLNGETLRVSAKTELADAIVATGQAEAGQNDTYRRLGDSIVAMLGRALVVRVTVPSTFPILDVAAGHFDAFWQYETVLPGVAAGVLLVTEAGGVVTDTRGGQWSPGTRDILIAAPGVHAAAIEAISNVG